MGGMPLALHVWLYKCCSQVDPKVATKLVFKNIVPNSMELSILELPPPFVEPCSIHPVANETNQLDDFLDVQPHILTIKEKEKVGYSSSTVKNKPKQQTVASPHSTRIQVRHVVKPSIKKMLSIQPLHFVSSIAKEKDLMCEYINGYRLYDSIPWYTVDNIFIPINVKNKLHWVLAVLSLRDRCIYVYDFLISADHDVAVKHEIDKLSQLLPIYLSTMDFYQNKGITSSTHPRYNIQKPLDSFEVMYVDNISQQRNGSMDCGLFVDAYTKILSGGEGIPNSNIDVELLRNRYSSILWDYAIKKIEADSMSEDEAPPRKIRPIVESSSSDRTILS
ncbi:hypothetical protein HAX54_010373 [Datura stramonium]|uniref:Ubiquitin-like protease family profile domain-containing protein n=1 Tax=Datura stramonium TaxID=4076 RepID=A0ABS8THY7_DATST|nr:hypothetical protein [Datura stramonium]